jgi:hypothetical protein
LDIIGEFFDEKSTRIFHEKKERHTNVRSEEEVGDQGTIQE